MDDDDEHSGGGTLVIDPTAAQNARAGKLIDESTTALDPSSPGLRPHDNGPMATQVLPLTPEPGGQPTAPRPAAGVPAINKAATMPLPPPSSSPPTVGLSPLDFVPPGGSGPLPPMPPQMPPPAPTGETRPSYASLPKPLPDRPMLSESTVVSPDRKGGRGIFIVLALLAAGGLGALGFVLYTRMGPDGARPTAKPSSTSAESTASPPPATATVTATTAVAATTPPTSSTSSAPPGPSTAAVASAPPSAPPSATTSAPAGGTPEGSAIAALGRLREGLDRCVKSTAHVLPPTSPLLPDSLVRLRTGPYSPSPRDYLPAFFGCTQFRAEGPMSFAIQWQLQIPSWLGVAVAWVDTNGDGTADKAYAFTARLKERDVVEYGDVSPIEVGKISPMPR